MPRAQVRRNAANQPEAEVHLEGNEYLKVTIPVRFDSWAEGETFVIGPWKPDLRVAGVRLPTRAETVTGFTEVKTAGSDGTRALDATFSFEGVLTPDLLSAVERARVRAPEHEVIVDFPVDLEYITLGPPPTGLRYQPTRVSGLDVQARYSRDSWLRTIAPLTETGVWVLELAAPVDPEWKEVKRYLVDAQQALHRRDPLASRTVLSSCRAAWLKVKGRLGPHWQDPRELQRQFAARVRTGHLSKQERVELLGSNLTTLWNAVRYFTEMEGHGEGDFSVTYEDAVLAYRLTCVMLSYLSWNPVPYSPPESAQRLRGGVPERRRPTSRRRPPGMA